MRSEMYLDKCVGWLLDYERELAIQWDDSNAIHNWFVKNCQRGLDNNVTYIVHDDKLKLLKRACERVLEDHSLAEFILPTNSNIWMGSREYDNHYFEDLEFTVKEIDKLLKEDDFMFFEYYGYW